MTAVLMGTDRLVPAAADVPVWDAGLDLVSLVASLDEVDVARASSADLLLRAVGWERVAAMAQARQAMVVGELAARRGVGPDRVVDELQAAMSCAAYQAQQTVLRAQGLAAHPALADAMAAGEVDARRVDAVLHALPAHGDPRRWAGVVAAVLEDASMWSAPQLRRKTERLVVAAEPGEAQARCERARQERRVELFPDGAGMAWLSAYLPAPEAVAAFTVVDALAGTHREPGDERAVDERRADAFAGVFTAIAATGTLPDGSALPRKRGRRAEIQVTVAATTLRGLDDLPGELAGYGPITAETARRIAQDGTWRRLLTDPVTGVLVERGSATYPPGGDAPVGCSPGVDASSGDPPGLDAAPVGYRPGADLAVAVVARDVTCTFMGCGQPGGRCELDHEQPYDFGRPGDDQTTVENLAARCKHHHELKTHGGWNVRRLPSGASEWTDPLGLTFTRLAIPIALTATALRCIRGPSEVGPPESEGGTPKPGCGQPEPDRPPSPSAGYPDDPPF